MGSAVVLAGLMFTTTTSPQASAQAVDKKINVVLLGDSYSAGNGAGSYERGAEEKSYRSTVNWAREYVKWLNYEGIKATFDNRAYSGSVTNDLLEDGGQIDDGVQKILIWSCSPLVAMM